MLNSEYPQKIHIVRVRHINNVVRYFFFKMVSGGKRKHLETASNLLRTILLSSIGGDVERAAKAASKGSRHLQNANADHGAMWREMVMENHSGNLDVVENSALMHVAGPANKIRCYGYLDQYINTPSDFSITVRPSDDESFFRLFLELMDRPEGIEDETPGAAEFVGSYSIDADSATYNAGQTREIVKYPDPGFIDKSLKKLKGWRSDVDTFLDGNQ